MSHIIDTPLAKRALCGELLGDKDSFVLLKFAAAHTYPMDRCVACYSMAQLAYMLAQPEQMSLLDGAA